MQADQSEDAHEDSSLAFDDLRQQLASNAESPELGEGLSLEELRQSYAGVLGKQPVEPDSAAATEHGLEDQSATEVDPDVATAPEKIAETYQVSPLSILEALLFVGQPDNSPISAQEVAGLMRGVAESDLPGLVQQLNQAYQASDRALIVEESPHGYRLTISPELSAVRERFYGRVRSVALNQAAIDCLALIAYQPGISREELEKQRAQPSGGILNQLVRRQLIQVHREGEGKKHTLHYHPTDKLLQLAGLASIEDLPQVEEFD